MGYGASPKPIVFIPPFFGKSFTVPENGFLDVGILLFGRFTRYLPHAALGLSMLGQSGIGSERRYDVIKLEEMRCSFSKEVVYDGSTINIRAMRTVDMADYASDGASVTGNLSIGFETPIMVKTGEFPPALDKLLGMIRQRLILYVNEYGDGAKIPDENRIGHKYSLKSLSWLSQRFRFLPEFAIWKYILKLLFQSLQ